MTQALAKFEDHTAAAVHAEAGGPKYWLLATVLFDVQRDWSEETFGPHYRPKGIVDHIRKELVEIEEDPYVLEEWIDQLFLAIDGATRLAKILIEGGAPYATPGHLVLDAYLAKLDKNTRRQWPDWRTADPDKAIEHVKGIHD